ncbi:hypothetical protein ACLQ3C_05545 [Gordonia sp. DT30]|uniref:hypothetical protein n=1 Tax=Gordonia sp. DT30 TaxID=3416546 RepID=UPI003CF6FA62
MRSSRAMWSLCRSVLGPLGLDLPLDVDQLCERYGAQRGRPIRLLAHPLPAGVPNGVWLAAEDADYFFHQANTTRWHRDQIVIHEFAHLICGHQMLADMPAVLAGLSDADADSSLQRTCYDDEREREAETVASMILTWAAQARDGVGATSAHPDVRGLQRLLGGHKGWL